MEEHIFVPDETEFSQNYDGSDQIHFAAMVQDIDDIAWEPVEVEDELTGDDQFGFYD